MTLVSSFREMVQQISYVMTVPTFNSFLILLTGWVFARRRTVTGMLLAAGAVGTKHHSAFHRVFATARWSLDEMGLALFRLLLPGIRQETIGLALDDTLARKRGRKVFGVGMHHDPLLSTRKTALMSWGHNWVVLGVIVELPFCPGRCFCLPILFRLYVSRQTAARQHLPYRTRPELAVEMLHRWCNRYPDRHFHVVADAAYGGQSVYRNLPVNGDLTSRLSLDARLYEAAPVRRPGTNGRPRRRGRRLPSPRQMLRKRGRRWAWHIYGRKDRCRVVERVAYLHALPERPVRVVAVEPLTGGRPRQAFYSTCPQASAREILTRYARRWSLEEAFQHSKTHLGFEQPPGWSRRAVERTAPTAMLLYSLIVLWFASVGHRAYHPPYRPWYRRKSRPSFADMLATLRQESVREGVLSPPGTQQTCENLLQAFIRAVTQAA